ncbi:MULTISPECIES: AraC family transcriptional regulator [unclassified Streptomyces]|uniref:helix-turn-helix domain-containing protein n=1 Tax=unclassified Streptomyces TaxID=2593676 RepID=UPI00278BD406|nr:MULTISPECIES: helix-turn-helix domain-containing protein [unclassified Streptomyces]
MPRPPWEIAVPAGPVPGPLRGLRMAGFSDRRTDLRNLLLIPHPSVTLAFNLGGAPLSVDDGAGRRGCERLVIGLAPDTVRAGGERGFACLQLRLSPLLAHAVLGAPGGPYGEAVDLDALWGRAAAERLQERLRVAGSWPERFAIAERALALRAQDGPVVDPEVAYAWRRLAADHGLVRVDRLARETGWSRKRLWSRFRAQVGLTPQHAARLIRFDRAAHRLSAGTPPSRVAADSGYADQSHLHRDVRAFTGATPSAIAETPFLAVDDVAWAAPRGQ